MELGSQTSSSNNYNQSKSGLGIFPLFTGGIDPFNKIKWECRSGKITNDRGQIVFEQNDIETPDFWSQMAVNVVSSKYFYGERNLAERENSIRALVSRVADTITKWGGKDSYFENPEQQEIFCFELRHILINQIAAFNSPVWFNVGVREKPQCSACFILSVDDSMDALLELQKTEGLLFKYGSGTGTNLSSLRSTREKLKGGGRPSGPVSFMRGFDAWAGIIKSGGKTRRAAKMQMLNATHPDILEFINAKVTEEKKAWALIDAGYDGGFAVSGGAYDSVAFQNANFSVRVDDEFMQAVKENKKYFTKNVADGSICEEHEAREILRQIAENTYVCGDPGLQYDSTINKWHTCPQSGRINGSNPCSEYMHLDNSACNLASINLLKFLDADGNFKAAEFCHTVKILMIAQDILIDNSCYPTEKIADCAKNFRQLGLGYANLGAALMSLGLPYNSEEGRKWAANITAIMSAQAYLTSSQVATVKGAFAGYEINSADMLRVIEQHSQAAKNLKISQSDSALKDLAVELWEQTLQFGKVNGFRNSQATVLAPTGTISFLMDCDTTGIEPDISLVKYKSLSGGGTLKITNRTVTPALKNLGYTDQEIDEIVSYISAHDTIEGAPYVSAEDLEVFDCAFPPANGKRCIHHDGHLLMMAAVQPFISGAISKTVNLPKDCSVDEIYNIYLKGWELNLKAVALYRDGSKRIQPLNNKKVEKLAEVKVPVAGALRKKLPPERNSVTHKFSIAGLEGYLTVGLYPEGNPGEIFLLVAKEGSTLSGIMDSFATSVSLALQYGVPLEALAKKFIHSRFEPAGFTMNPEIPMATSLIDYVFRWLAVKFLKPEQVAALGIKAIPSNDAKTFSAEVVDSNLTKGNRIMDVFHNSEDAPPCLNCGSGMMVRQAGCYVCLNCGSQGGCG